MLLILAGMLEGVVLLLVGVRRLAGVFGELGSLAALRGWLGLWLGHLRRLRLIFDLILALVIQHIHELLQDFLVLAIDAHIHILVILRQSLFFIPA